MSALSLEDLQKRKTQLEAELEQVKTYLFRLDGALGVVKQFIEEFDKPKESQDPIKAE